MLTGGNARDGGALYRRGRRDASNRERLQRALVKVWRELLKGSSGRSRGGFGGGLSSSSKGRRCCVRLRLSRLVVGYE